MLTWKVFNEAETQKIEFFIPRVSCASTLCLVVSNPFGLAQIRLTGGRTRYEGRVEVLGSDSNGTQSWGLICGESWSPKEAMVACRQLGLGYANQGLQVG